MKKLVLAASISLISTISFADSSLATFMSESKTALDLRYRFETVEQEGFNENAIANTLRTRLGFTSGQLQGVNLTVEFDDVRHLGDDDFNSTGNGNTAYPVVADPSGTDLNQLYAKYQMGKFSATAGRQRINLDDQRFVGGVAWRQNEQTYDGARFEYGSKAFSVDYSYVAQVNRIFGPTGGNASLDGDLHLLNAAWLPSDAHKIIGFVYDMDFEDANSASNQTYGLRYQGKLEPIQVIASYASQSETGDAALDYSADYYLLEASANIDKLSLTAGYEVLGSDGGLKGFQTPLATGHKFQGFADKFLGTPANGVQDAYLSAAMPVGPLKVALFYHDFQSDEGSSNYGSEWDLVLAYAVTPQLKALLKLADYTAEDLGTDTQKIWLQVQFSL